MLAYRVIPVILARGAMLVKGTQFCSWRNVGVAQQAVEIYQARQVDELIYLDIEATPSGKGPDFAAVRRLTDKCYMPITVGGGVRGLADVRGLLEAGADKIAIRSAGPAVIEMAARVVGCQAIVASIDVTTGWRTDMSTPASLTQLAVQHCVAAANAGAGEILLTRIEREGMMNGYDLDLIREVSAAVDIPVIANGGAGAYHHMAEAIQAGASAVAAGSMFQFTDQTPKEAAQYLHEHGIEARI